MIRFSTATSVFMAHLNYMTSSIMPLSFVNQLFFQLQAGVSKNFWHLCNSGLSKSHSEPLPSCYWQQAELWICYCWWICCSISAGKVSMIRTQKLIPCLIYRRFICLVPVCAAFLQELAKGRGQGPEMERGKLWTPDGIVKFVKGEKLPR